MQIKLIFVILFVNTALAATTSNAFEYYGATVNDQDAPSSYMRYGIHGYRATITVISDNSPAYKAGFRQGNIILSVNDKAVKKSTELSTLTADVLNVLVFNGLERNTFVINRLALETENANLKAAERKTAGPTGQNTNIVQQPDNSAPLVFNNDDLDRRYGKTTPEQRAREAKRAGIENIRYQNEINAKNKQIRERQPLIISTVDKPVVLSPYALKEKQELQKQLNYLDNNSSIVLNCSLREKEQRIEKVKAKLAKLENDPTSYMNEQTTEKINDAEDKMRQAESAADFAEMKAQQAENKQRDAEDKLRHAEQIQRDAEQKQQNYDIWHPKKW